MPIPTIEARRRGAYHAEPVSTTTTLGAIAFENEFCIVRAKSVHKTGKRPKVQVAIHARDHNGNEVTPLGYVLGTNLLWFEQR